MKAGTAAARWKPLNPEESSAVAAVAYLGPAGTFSEAVARAWLADIPGAGETVCDCGSIDEVFREVEQGRARYGVVPVENSTEGAVNNTQDCLIDSPLQIVGERIVPIEHQLFARPGTGMADLRRIVSHRQSLAQCRRWLRAHCGGLPLQECASNAEAARLSAAQPGTGAIAGAAAGGIYGLQTLAAGIQDQAHNSTRFLVLVSSSDTTPSATGRDKTSLLVWTENRPGALFRILEPFERLQISLTKIETRPSRKEAWAYVFFIDFEGHRDDDLVQELFRRLDRCTAEVKILGSYPAAYG